jgi:hypothetical protein
MSNPCGTVSFKPGDPGFAARASQATPQGKLANYRRNPQQPYGDMPTTRVTRRNETTDQI